MNTFCKLLSLFPGVVVLCAASVMAQDAGRRPGGFEPGRMFDMLDRNQDGQITKDEVPERARGRLMPIFERLGKDVLTKDDVAQAIRQQHEGGRRPEAGDRPDGFRPRPDRGSAGFRVPLLFEKLDSDHDRRISHEELAQAVSKFAELDVNGDGYLDVRELLGPQAGREGAKPFQPNERGRRPGAQPFRPEGAGPGQRHPEQADRPAGRPADRGESAENLINRLDRNGDGSISQDEVPEKLKDKFPKIDSNGDGQIDASELQEAVKRRRNP